MCMCVYNKIISGLYSEFKVSLGYRGKPCLNKQTAVQCLFSMHEVQGSYPELHKTEWWHMPVISTHTKKAVVLDVQGYI